MTTDIELSLDFSDIPLLQDYYNIVMQGGAWEKYSGIVQRGKKDGQNLFSHVFNGITVLETLRGLLELDETEARVLYIAFTIHDLNKVTEESISFSKLVTPVRVRQEIEQLGLSDLFPDGNWEDYIEDITTLIRGHSAHYGVAAETWNRNSSIHYKLGTKRIEALIKLMRAADVIDLSKTLLERKHKDDFLSHLNAYLADSGIDQMYVFRTHQLVEQRGLLSNIMHNEIALTLQDIAGWTPLLLYADGTVYLAPKGQDRPALDRMVAELGSRIHQRFKEIIQGNAADLIEQTAQGIKFKPDALTALLPFEALFSVVWGLVQRRKFKRDDLEIKARERLQKSLAKLPQEADLSRFLQEQLDSPTPFIEARDEQMRGAELARTYYILLNRYADQFPKIENVWAHIYQLLGLPTDRFPIYEAFDALYDRPYVMASDLVLTEEEVYERLVADGTKIWPSTALNDTPPTEESSTLWQDYVQRYVCINGQTLSGQSWNDHLTHYVKHQHKQCIHCSAPFETEKWRAADVRDDIGVQKFSNRLRGGGSAEPVKNICKVCRIQFLLETLNYETVRGEQTFYLHFYPRTYHTPAYQSGLRNAFADIQGQDVALQALNMRVDEVFQLQDRLTVRPHFAFQTKEGKPMPYGIYVPKYSDSVSNILILPINAAGDNETERYLFALWQGVVLGAFWNVKVVLSRDPVPPLAVDSLPELFLDLVPLSCTGLLPHHDRLHETEGESVPVHAQLPSNGFNTDDVKTLWNQAYHLFALRKRLFPAGDEMVGFVHSLTSGPLYVFNFIDRLLEKSKNVLLAREVLPHVEPLAFSIGGKWMMSLSEALKTLTAFAWKNGIRGGSLKRNSLLDPLDEILGNLAQSGREWDEDAIIAMTAQSIFDHIERISDYKLGQTKRDACTKFVRDWYTHILNDVYRGNRQKLLSDSKQLRSAYLFYLQSQIPQRSPNTQTEESES